MSFFGKIFGTKGVDKVVGKAVDVVDKLIYTKQEKAEHAKKIADAHIEFIKLTMNESTARSITRRILSVCIMGVFLLLVLSATFFYFVDKEFVAHVINIIDTYLGALTLLVATFYFGSYAFGQYINKKQTKQ